MPRELRLPFVPVHWRSCKQNNWCFLVQTAFCPFLLLLQQPSAKFQTLQTFVLGVCWIIITSKLIRYCLKSNVSEWKEVPACIVHLYVTKISQVIQFSNLVCYLRCSFVFCNSLIFEILKPALCSKNRECRREERGLREKWLLLLKMGTSFLFSLSMVSF